MYYILTLFLASLLGIAYMIGRKWKLIKNGYVFEEKNSEMSEIEYLEELQRSAKNGLRKFGFVLLVIIIRLYVKTSAFVAKVAKAGISEIDKLYSKVAVQNSAVPREPNTFLKKMGEYKRKVKRIKDRVKREERM